MQKNDFIFSEEYELKQTISARQEYDLMIGDPLFKSFIPCKKYIDHPNIAVSGRLYASEIDRVFGKWGDAFIKNILHRRTYSKADRIQWFTAFLLF